MNTPQQSAPVYSPKKVLKGANLYCNNSILVAELDSSVSAKPVDAQFLEMALNAINEFRPAAAKANLNAMPPLSESFFAGNNAGNAAENIAQVINYLALTLQRWCGLPVTFAKVLEKLEGAKADHIVFECRLDHLATAAGQIAAEACLHCMSADIIPKSRLQQIIGEFDRVFIKGRETQIPFVREAEEQGIPWTALTADGAILTFGQGSKLRKIHQNFTSSTSLIASRVATDKYTTANVLRAQGVPVPHQIVVTTNEAALDAARKINFPVVIKPARNDYGTAVFVDVRTEDEASRAFNEAAKHGPVIMERLIAGEHHRIMVINGKFRSVRKQLPAHVIGDGAQTVSALVEQANEARLKNGWQPIPTDEESKAQLQKQNLTFDSIAASNQMVRLRSQANLSTGGTMEDVSANAHPANIALAERAAAIVDIDVAGLDFITTDISKPFWEVQAAFCEVNVTPGLIQGEEKLILSEWFSDESKGRVITIVVLDPSPEKNSGTKITEQLQSKFSKVCLATQQGMLLDGKITSPGNFSNHRGLRAALCEPGVNAVVLEISSEELIKEGLGMPRCDLAVMYAAEEGADQQLIGEARKILESVSACVLDNSIVKEGKNASFDAKQLAREINSILR